MHSKDHLYLVIMAGGIGSRFWPMSTRTKPKQFQDVLGNGKTLYQDTIERMKGLVKPENMYVITAAEYTGYAAEQAPEIPQRNILGEPMKKNTAPCLSLAAKAIHRRDPEGVMIVTPSDHFIRKEGLFNELIERAVDFLDKQPEALFTLGIQPDRPETGYGYIHAGTGWKDQIVEVEEFKEKPDAATALKYIQEGNYLWNSGIFIWKVSTILERIASFLPEMSRKFDEITWNNDLPENLPEIYASVDGISIDYGIMEKAKHIYVTGADIGWSDLGTWGSLWQMDNKDAQGNSQTPDRVILSDTKECLIRVPQGKNIIIEGLNDYIVVDDAENLLIFRKSNEQQIGDLSKKLS